MFRWEREDLKKSAVKKIMMDKKADKLYKKSSSPDFAA